ncbi:hydroxymethylglutaryl-CoA lyase [Rubrimonas cliftonensis]|uniref:Hydroxymethylglutaryl-CoA lyase n=1 Tax=Rubrimonas cliftonensis TaxID=89524 RepID=A0A1H3XPP3_9RHOB|nr:hydroxymethylglutaryl-CoA lyase [Rubrimonas cliftonensis]SEA01425.1 hydroxymethylglutaryl-CoA lyase [Rubrimonas cliftonensis]
MAAPSKERARVYEVGPRDGLQNEKRMIPSAQKIALIDALSACGFERIEAASFVSPRAVPQMADGAEVLAGVTRAPGVLYAALTPNLRGYQAARAAGADEVAVFASASEGFSRANVNASVAESLERFAPVAEAARADGAPMRAYVSCAVACPFDGPTPPAAVARLVESLLALGAREVSLGDTIGAGTPETVRAMLREALEAAPPELLAGHFHDTGGRAVENVAAACDMGLRVFDAAVAGLGGCPFAPGAPGNVDTRAVVLRLEALGLATGVNLDRLAEAEAQATRIR